LKKKELESSPTNAVDADASNRIFGVKVYLEEHQEDGRYTREIPQ
jgi:hypothetical protein